MGEETKQEQIKPGEKKEENAEAKKEEEDPKPLSPFILFVDLHCMGCAKKIQKSILRIRGVEGVVIDMAQNQLTIKGVVEPQAVCAKIMKKTHRTAKVLSPLPAAEGEPIPEVIASQVDGLITVELNVNMHCEACAQQLKRKILKMKGVRTVETYLSTGKVTVTGTMDANRLVDNVYRRTRKQAKIVPQPEHQKKQLPEEEAKPEEKKQEEKPSEEEAKPEEIRKEETIEKKDGAAEKLAAEKEKKEGGGDGCNNNENNYKVDDGDQKGDENKEEIEKDGGDNNNINIVDEQSIQRMMYYYYEQPLHIFERMPPAPQLFSDENPNACCIT